MDPNPRSEPLNRRRELHQAIPQTELQSRFSRRRFLEVISASFLAATTGAASGEAMVRVGLFDGLFKAIDKFLHRTPQTLSVKENNVDSSSNIKLVPSDGPTISLPLKTEGIPPKEISFRDLLNKFFISPDKIIERSQGYYDRLKTNLAHEKVVLKDRIEDTRVWYKRVKEVVTSELKSDSDVSAAEIDFWTKIICSQIGIESKGDKTAKYPPDTEINRLRLLTLNPVGEEGAKAKKRLADLLAETPTFGLMQISKTIMNEALERMKRNGTYNPNKDYNIFYPDDNIRFGFNEIRYLYKLFGNNLELALTAFNAGQGDVTKRLQDYLIHKKGMDPTKIRQEFANSGLDGKMRATEIYGKGVSFTDLYPKNEDSSYLPAIFGFARHLFPEDFNSPQSKV